MRCLAVTFVGLVLGISGCLGSENEHPPNVECDGEGCVGPSNGHASGATKGTGGSSSGGASSTNSSAAGQAGQVTVEGKIVVVDEPRFSVSQASMASGNFTLRAPGAAGSDVTAMVTPDFSVTGLRATKTLWLSAKPASNADLLTGIASLDSTKAGSVTVPVVRASTLQLLASLLPLPTVLDKTKGQVVLRLVDEAGTPISGLNVAASGIETIAYDEGGSYTNDRRLTGARGLAILINVDAAATPSAMQVSLTGSRTTEFAVWVQSGAATALELVVAK